MEGGEQGWGGRENRGDNGGVHGWGGRGTGVWREGDRSGEGGIQEWVGRGTGLGRDRDRSGEGEGLSYQPDRRVGYAPEEVHNSR